MAASIFVWYLGIAAGKCLWLMFQVQHLTIMCMELHARTRRDLEPDPEFDPICAVFYCLSSDSPLPQSDKTRTTGAIVITQDPIASQGAEL